MRAVDMHLLQELVRLHRLGLSNRVIAKRLSISRNTERKYRGPPRGSDSSIALDQLDPEVLADQSLAIVRARRELMVRGVLTIGLMVAALLLTVAMLESLVWKY